MKGALLKVAIIQRFCTHYRIPLFKRINECDDIRLTVVVNDSKILGWNKENLGFEIVCLPAIVAKFNFGEKNYHIPLSFSLIRHLLQERYDVIISEGVTNIANNLLIYPISRLCGSKYIWWGAGRRRFAKKNILRKIADPIVNYLIKNANADIAYGSVARDYMISVGANHKKVFIAQNTIDTKRIFNTLEEIYSRTEKCRKKLRLNGKKIILYVGIIEKRKKVENLILAYKGLLKQTSQPLALIIVGDGPYLGELKEWFLNQKPLQDVYFIGKMVEGVELYFAMCDVFVLPSEGGLSLNQAMAYGKPVIATSADGTEIDLIKNGKNGYIIAEDDIPALIEVISRVILNPEKQRAMGRQSASSIKEKFTMDKMVKGFQLAIESVTKAKSHLP